MLESILDFKRQRNEAVFLPFKGVQRFWSNFKCKKCGGCCDGNLMAKGSLIKLTKGERKRLEAKTELMEYPCKFYNDGCTIYKERPYSCRAYPLQKQFPLMASPHCPAVRELILNYVGERRC